MALDESLQLADQLVVASQSEICVDPLLERGEPKLLEPGDLRLRERLVREVGQRRPAPERERVTEPIGRQLRVVASERLSPLLEPALEDGGVERLGTDAKDISVTVCFEPRGRSLAVRVGKRLPETGDVRLQRLRRGRGRALAPEVVDERVLRHDLVRAEEEGGPAPRWR